MKSPAFVVDTVVVILLLLLLGFTIALLVKLHYDLKALSRKFALNHIALELNVAESFCEAAGHFITRAMPGDLLQNQNIDPDLSLGLLHGGSQPSAPKMEDACQLEFAEQEDHLYDNVDLHEFDSDDNVYEIPS